MADKDDINKSLTGPGLYLEEDNTQPVEKSKLKVEDVKQETESKESENKAAMHRRLENLQAQIEDMEKFIKQKDTQLSFIEEKVKKLGADR
ncbi:hypothetical protein G7Y89_g11759 [Cudoniella acicularis]|uniref:Uncharacterized protein n=1 Tax=Cudoniella acicularis TaxID=354080 RepID=A0A8H4RBS1_9HELO|nr:hypothetical protein G7Y89_g11759 [Cudoniella acicularis]